MPQSYVAPEIIEKFLDRLASDDVFREKMLGNPVAALKEFDIDVDPADVPAVRQLPSKQTLQSQHEQLVERIKGDVGLWIFMVK